MNVIGLLSAANLMDVNELLLVARHQWQYYRLARFIALHVGIGTFPYVHLNRLSSLTRPKNNFLGSASSTQILNFCCSLITSARVGYFAADRQHQQESNYTHTCKSCGHFLYCGNDYR